MYLFKLATGSLVLALLAACTSNPTMQDKASAEFAGLNKITSSGFQEAWGRPGTRLSDYKVISASTLESADAEIVQPASSTGSRINRDWELNPQRQQGLAESWANSITRAADKAGLDTSGGTEKVLRIDARLTRLAPSANFGDEQSTPGRSSVYTESSGEASIEFKLYDQSSDELLVVIRDKRKVGPQMWGRSNSVTASADMRNLFNTWANNLTARISGN